MKNFLLLFFFAIQQTFSIGQVKNLTKEQTDTTITPKDTNEHIFQFVEEMPEFPGGIPEMYKFIQDNLVNHEQDLIRGKVFLKFLVNKEGNINNIEVLKGIKGYPDLEKEAIRVVKIMPPWKPGKQKGTAVAVWYTLPIDFSR